MYWLLSLLIAAIPAVQPQSTVSGADGPFRVLMITVPDFEQFERQWAVTTEGAEVTSTDKLVRGKPTFVVVVFGGCQVDDESNCLIEIRPRIIGPDGTPYGGMDGTQALPAQKVPVSRPDAFFLSPQSLGIEIEPDEALGPYRIEITVTDLHSARSLQVYNTLIAVVSE